MALKASLARLSWDTHAAPAIVTAVSTEPSTSPSADLVATTQDMASEVAAPTSDGDATTAPSNGETEVIQAQLDTVLAAHDATDSVAAVPEVAPIAAVSAAAAGDAEAAAAVEAEATQDQEPAPAEARSNEALTEVSDADAALLSSDADAALLSSDSAGTQFDYTVDSPSGPEGMAVIPAQTSEEKRIVDVGNEHAGVGPGWIATSKSDLGWISSNAMDTAGLKTQLAALVGAYQSSESDESEVHDALYNAKRMELKSQILSLTKTLDDLEPEQANQHTAMLIPIESEKQESEKLSAEPADPTVRPQGKASFSCSEAVPFFS